MSPEATAPPLDESWVPIRVHGDAGGLEVDWCHLGPERFTAPFFDQTVEDRLRHPFALLFQHRTSIDALVERQRIRPGLPVRGLVFHMSRCGSTLLAQLLAALPRHVVLSEAGPVDTVLRAHRELPGLTDAQRITWLQAVVAALGQRRHPDEEAVFLKLDAWHALELPLFQRAFPGVPWVFLYREPLEVMASHARHRGAHMLPGALGLAPREAAGMPTTSLDEYGARMLARICEAGLRAFQHRRDAPARLVDFTQLHASAADLLPELFDLKLTADERQHLREVAGRDAKNPVLPFEENRDEKARGLTPEARAQTERHLRSAYERLEAERQGR
ncbi:sulfotransferase family protein [Corallococcus sp. M34]|uniref:sulfotransferase family protein n=1 Tax=Citreicoccus inhibens TaxID=2849499 RepID=UPI001C2356ED|nr:sulfotransferase family protein [Citreicoccus inhibens]MBU8898533.1 sulfotransferase family protein [Citreicoccus inhibens]